MNKINRTFILFQIITFSLLSCKTSTTEQKSGQVEKPNIIYILADDLGYGDLSCYGQEKFQTPNIDKLAIEGMKFTDHYSGSTVCAPSRSVLLTGQHTGHTPIRGNKEYQPEGQFPMDSAAYTIAELMKESGYKTGAFGKWGLGFIGTEGDPLNQGFDEFYGYNCQRYAHKYYPTHLWQNNKKIILEGNGLVDTAVYAQDLIHEEALKFMEANKENPFFLFLPYVIPHAELIVPNDSIFKMFDGKFQEGKPYHDPSGDYGDPKVRVGGYCSQDKPRATFAAMVTRLDIYVGEVLSKLKELELDENTIVMFASDNGPHTEGGADPKFFNSSGNLRGVKRDLYEGGIRTPFLVRWPGKVKAGSTSEHISAFWDVLPTFAELANKEVPGNINGISFLPTLLEEENQAQHKYLYWEFHEWGGRQAIRMGNWKAVKNGVKKNPSAKIELYNLDTDISETNDLAEENPEVIKEMEALFAKARVANKNYPFIEAVEGN